MRLWSLHPKYLDTRGLLALWRESLLAKHVLEGQTKGYKNHPQLYRFKNNQEPLAAINQYLNIIYQEGVRRDFKFNASKFKKPKKSPTITVTKGQLIYEFEHLLKKLKKRDQKLYNKLQNTKKISPHPIFIIVEGKIEKWEIKK